MKIRVTLNDGTEKLIVASRWESKDDMVFVYADDGVVHSFTSSQVSTVRQVREIDANL